MQLTQPAASGTAAANLPNGRISDKNGTATESALTYSESG